MELPEQYQEVPKKKITIRKIFWAVFTAILILLAMIEIMFPAKAAHAADTGWHDAQTFADDSSNGGAGTWLFPSRAIASDNSYASVGLGKCETSHYLKATNFNFSIPTGSTITGIEYETERATFGVGTGVDRDKDVYLTFNGSLNGRNLQSPTNWTTADVLFNHGNATDNWDTTLTADDFNDSSFGFVLSVKEQNCISNKSARIDYVHAKIYYEPPVAEFNTTFLYPFFPTAWASTTCQFVTNGSTTTAECNADASSTQTIYNPSQNLFNGFVLFFLALFGLTAFLIRY